MSESDNDLEEVRANPDALKIYVMYYGNKTYLCAGKDAVEAAQNITNNFGVDVDSLSVSQGIVINEKFARICPDRLWLRKEKII